jgi:AcrR family transcriptional regulator
MVAEEADVDTATLTATAGNKNHIYRTVIERAYQVEEAMMTTAMASFTPTLGGVLALADSYLAGRCSPWPPTPCVTR